MQFLARPKVEAGFSDPAAEAAGESSSEPARQSPPIRIISRRFTPP